jgi:hypothetical protein
LDCKRWQPSKEYQVDWIEEYLQYEQVVQCYGGRCKRRKQFIFLEQTLKWGGAL